MTLMGATMAVPARPIIIPLRPPGGAEAGQKGWGDEETYACACALPCSEQMARGVWATAAEDRITPVLAPPSASREVSIQNPARQ